MSPWGSLRERDLYSVEDMDRPGCDQRRLTRTYARFPVVNRLLSGWRRTYQRRIRPLLAETGHASLLDIGSGSGDVARGLARWARRDGFVLEVTAIDPDERAFEFASHVGNKRVANKADVTYRRAHSSELVAEGVAFDVVISNHILHHLDAQQFAGVLRDSELLTRHVALHNDLARSNVAYVLFMAGFWPLGFGSYIVKDGLLSIRRSYTLAELKSAISSAWTAERNGPWHNMLVHEPQRSESREGA
ncbi:class I SAM-dependent methyltransferase [Paenarthrobacter nitroguajacolicus]|uniref:class I SAM-dependent methyltransferase n=1 Tax=Paenarthrobacter nitroguajacolicus TaxID=211146 RepID=UPI00248B4249|nr:class I SAM-dependent methyltransferase [Paenarthrobacter nitroguajacolicus]MDI2033965.1 Ubiquinone biosynthesis O-methyltransferase, mitochondrial [Paenarthrobacter nitroguajacolicus]